jgi:hypothetical protein
MIDRIWLLIFTPTYDKLLRHETVASLVAQQTRHWLTWEIGRQNPYPTGSQGRDMRNVLAQYNYAREMCLSGPYDALLTVEHDMVLPPHAVQALCDTPAPVVYGTYTLRHGGQVINAWQYIGQQGLGMSLNRYPDELRALARAGVGRVSGVGFGCTLLRRQVLERVPFRSDTGNHAPDMPFALDCVRLGITQLARFDVRCGHIHEGVILEQEQRGPTAKVKVKQAVNILLDGGGVSLMEGDELELPIDQAMQLADLGHVDMVAAAPATAAPALQETETQDGNPQGAAVPKRSAKKNGE